jgi:hypothetical protein
VWDEVLLSPPLLRHSKHVCADDGSSVDFLRMAADDTEDFRIRVGRSREKGVTETGHPSGSPHPTRRGRLHGSSVFQFEAWQRASPFLAHGFELLGLKP